MANANGENPTLWLAFTLMTVLMWGLYGLCLHSGQIGMGDAVNGGISHKRRDLDLST